MSTNLVLETIRAIDQIRAKLAANGGSPVLLIECDRLVSIVVQSLMRRGILRDSELYDSASELRDEIAASMHGMVLEFVDNDFKDWTETPYKIEMEKDGLILVAIQWGPAGSKYIRLTWAKKE